MVLAGLRVDYIFFGSSLLFVLFFSFADLCYLVDSPLPHCVVQFVRSSLTFSTHLNNYTLFILLYLILIIPPHHNTHQPPIFYYLLSIYYSSNIHLLLIYYLSSNIYNFLSISRVATLPIVWLVEVWIWILTLATHLVWRRLWIWVRVWLILIVLLLV